MGIRGWYENVDGIISVWCIHQGGGFPCIREFNYMLCEIGFNGGGCRCVCLLFVVRFVVMYVGFGHWSVVWVGCVRKG